MRRALSLLVLVLCALPGVAGPAAKKGKGPGPLDPAAGAVEKAVRQYVKDQIEEEGSFTVEDDVLGKAWDSKIISLRLSELRRHPGGQVSVCVDFRAEDEKNSQPMDLDFVLSQGDGEWVVDETHIHKIGRTPRFTYSAKFERVPVKGKKGAKPAVPAGEPGE